MARRDDNLQARLDRDLAELKLLEIAKSYREVLDEAARKGSSMLEVLATLIGMEQTARQQRALERRMRQAASPQTENLGRVRFQLPQAGLQGGDPAVVRLRLYPGARLRRDHWAHRNRKDVSSHGAWVTRRPSVVIRFVTRV